MAWVNQSGTLKGPTGNTGAKGDKGDTGSPGTGLESDVAWVDLALAAGLAGSAQYCVKGGINWVRYDVSGTFPDGYTTLSTALPAAQRPSTVNARNLAFMVGDKTGIAYVTLAGAIGILNKTGASVTNVQAYISYVK